jgi:hypothetical protein
MKRTPKQTCEVIELTCYEICKELLSKWKHKRKSKIVDVNSYHKNKALVDRICEANNINVEQIRKILFHMNDSMIYNDIVTTVNNFETKQRENETRRKETT